MTSLMFVDGVNKLAPRSLNKLVVADDEQQQ